MTKGENRTIIEKYKKFERTRQVSKSVQRKRGKLEGLADKILAEGKKKNDKSI